MHIYRYSSGFLSTSIFCCFNQFALLWPLHSAHWLKHGGCTECKPQVYSTNRLSATCSPAPHKSREIWGRNKSSGSGKEAYVSPQLYIRKSKQVYGLMRSDKRQRWQPSSIKCLGNNDNKAALTNRLHRHRCTSLKEACRWINDCCNPGRRLLAVVWQIRAFVAV